MNTHINIPPQVMQVYNQRLLSTPTANHIYSLAAEKKYMPRNSGTTMRMSRYNELPSSPVPLGNTGATPPSVDLTRVDIDVRPRMYGQWTAIHELVTAQNQDAVITAATLRLGQSLRKTEDELVRDMLVGTASVIDCTGGVNGDGPTEISNSDISLAVAALLRNNARVMSDGEEGTNKYGTAPTRNTYWALAHSDITSDLNDVDGFVHSSQYPSQKNIMSSEWGAVQNMRFFISSNGSISTAASVNGADVYNIICCGQEAYTIIEQDGVSSHLIYRNPMYSGPLAQYCTLAWKMSFGSTIQNDLWVLNLRCTRIN